MQTTAALSAIFIPFPPLAPLREQIRKNIMQIRILALLTAATLTTAIARGQQSPAASTAPAPTARTEVYHIHFNHAVPGKALALADFLKTSAPDAPMPGHVMLLRHEDGAPWDYVAIQHMGPKATVEAVGNPRSASMKMLSDWHDDTYVNGPSWAEFTKAMGLDSEGKSKSDGSVYVVSVYRPVPGHEDALEKFLSEPPSAANDLAVGGVLMQHLEGGAWRYLAIAHYKSWQDYATSQVNSVAQSGKGQGGWFTLREHVSFHNDTLTSRVAP